MALLARAGDEAPKLAQLCHNKYPRFDRIISTHIPAALREQARQFKRARAFGSFQEVYLEAVLLALVDLGLLTSALDTKPGNEEPAASASGQRRAA